MHSPHVFLAHERLSPAELSAARLDGHLVELGDAYIPADAIETVTLRAASMRGLVTEKLVACVWSAAWIYGALDAPPARHHLTRRNDRRVTSVVDSRAQFHDVGIPPEEVVEVGGIAVSSPVRTLVDVARRGGDPADEVRSREASRRLMALRLADAHSAIAVLDQHPRLLGRNTAVRLLAALSAEVGAESLRST